MISPVVYSVDPFFPVFWDTLAILTHDVATHYLEASPA
jgi:hypothetical protein